MEILNITITAYLYYGKLCEAEELKNLLISEARGTWNTDISCSPIILPCENVP
ncbi:MAG: hypothetical protein BAJALOKI1v1_1700006 [Promethearchaeota archaeon]|nr:MAG: hypothetical protein BAJALOKI1v1_1700006 [Candidatus Lokiarchaeota archaeon]